MGRYTSIVVVPADSTWEASAGDFRTIAEFLGATSVEILAFYEGPLLWDAEQGPSRTHSRLAADLAAAHLVDANEMSALVMFSYGAWAKSFSEEMEQLPADLSCGYVPWDVGVSRGRCSIPDLWQEHTAAEACFMLQISGDGCPADMNAYLEAVRCCRPLRDLVAFLKSLSNCEFETFVTLF